MTNEEMANDESWIMMRIHTHTRTHAHNEPPPAAPTGAAEGQADAYDDERWVMSNDL